MRRREYGADAVVFPPVKIGIIGAGNIGSTLVRRLTQLGHEVAVANSRRPETLSELAAETGATAATAAEAVESAELVVLTIPLARVADLPPGLFAALPSAAPLVDTGNYYPGRDGSIALLEDGVPESRWVEQKIGRPVVKAFNTIRAQHLLEYGKPAGAEGRIALPVAGDDPAAKAIVLRLVDELGFDAVDAGGIDDSWRQQPGRPAYDADADAATLRRLLADAG